MIMETYLRRGQRSLRRLALDSRVRTLGQAIAWTLGGFFLSAASIGGVPLPLAPGFISAVTGWRAGLMSLGAMVGFPSFWGAGGNIGIVWSAAGGLLAMLVGRLESSREQPWMMPMLMTFLTAVTEITFLLILKDPTAFLLRVFRVGLALFFSMLFAQSVHCRERITQWVTQGVLVLGLAQVRLGPFSLGHVCAGAMAACPFPAAVLAGVGLDLAKVSPVSMAACQCLAWFARQFPWPQKWQVCLTPALAYLGVSLAWGVWDTGPLPALVLGGFLGPLIPEAPAQIRRWPTGAAQVRLEMGANLMGRMQRILVEFPPPPIDAQALVEKARDLACSGCSIRKYCRASFTADLLEHPLDADCRKQARLVPELRRARDHYRLLLADRQRWGEYRLALQQQYQFLGQYLQKLGSDLNKGAPAAKAQFRCAASARSRSKERANGDTCVAFPGQDCCFYVLLCDGMGTGLGAAQEGHAAAVLLRQLLGAGFPAEHALETANNLLVLSGRSGAVTVDLAQIHLDTGIVQLYKWGAAPSWVLTRAGAEKIGTATYPLGLDLGKSRMVIKKLSLRRGETLVLLSDGLDGEDVLTRLTPDAPPGELAAKILEGSGSSGEDDATAAVIRLTPSAVPSS